jgi:hypothetical protein
MKPLPHPLTWTPNERIDVATALLSIIQLDIPAGRYSKIGRPNITSVLHVLHEPAEVLNEALDSLNKVLSKKG